MAHSSEKTKTTKIALFEGQEIRKRWDADKELWYFSVVDIVRVLTGSVDAGAYWRKLKQRLKEEGSEVVTKCHELKFTAKDGKNYFTDAADTEVALRIVQSTPSPNAEPFKLWLATAIARPSLAVSHGNFISVALPRLVFYRKAQ